jgi:hypothetical protein
VLYAAVIIWSCFSLFVCAVSIGLGSYNRKWRREQLVRFQAIDMFRFPVLDNVRYVMNLHFNGCFGATFSNVFNTLWNSGAGSNCAVHVTEFAWLVVFCVGGFVYVYISAQF